MRGKPTYQKQAEYKKHISGHVEKWPGSSSVEELEKICPAAVIKYGKFK